MITEFAFVPTVTTEEMRRTEDMKAKVKKINAIRRENSQALIAKGEEALEPYVFDYLLLCNKICGASHYNMQMKIIVETPQEFEKWMMDQQTFAEVIQ
jgi:cytochrome c oxidase subunit 2